MCLETSFRVGHVCAGKVVAPSNQLVVPLRTLLHGYLDGRPVRVIVDDSVPSSQIAPLAARDQLFSAGFGENGV